MTESAERPLSRRDLRILMLAALGGALEFYDFIIFVFFAAVIAQLFFPPGMPEWLRQLQTLGIFAAGYLARPLGDIIMAHFGDRAGRKRSGLPWRRRRSIARWTSNRSTSRSPTRSPACLSAWSVRFRA